VRKTPLLSHFYAKNFLPRQARDKHRETTQKKKAFCAGAKLHVASTPSAVDAAAGTMVVVQLDTGGKGGKGDSYTVSRQANGSILVVGGPPPGAKNATFCAIYI
jgi:hypothetical protein